MDELEPDNVDKGLTVSAIATSLIPWLGGPTSNILNGITQQRKLKRVHEVLDKVNKDLKSLENEINTKFAKSEDFEDLLEATLQRTFTERNEKKRIRYANFLKAAVKAPSLDYEYHSQNLALLENLQDVHVAALKAMIEPPKETLSSIGSPIRTLKGRLPEYDEASLKEALSDLVAWRLVNNDGFDVTMTASGAEDLSSRITEKGNRLMKYLLD